ncbi:uncharacterized protein LOC100201978 isoform X1 [Hydra vulgaris]|uniref:uncharacterized protein LOC100201978 isoform X1 n=1 Tax=Hydra vulgaris TaxID=6087 RepID=UPI001F5EF373|nr:uncharacterized protein LOC100201978 [Hydra vulgaris]
MSKTPTSPSASVSKTEEIKFNTLIEKRLGSGDTKRKEPVNKTTSHRIGPSPIKDASISTKTEVSTPGCLDSDLEDIDFRNFDSKISKAGCKGLLTYFSKLGHSSEDSAIDLDFVESLLGSGADINFSDKYGQSVIHEIVRDWNIESAKYVFKKGADLNKEDKYGRTPLHLASAVNHYEMVEWLITNGASINAKTIGENQTPLHYAAKNNAVDSTRIILHMGGDIGARDYKGRTPLFVAAETGRSQACRFLIEQGAPVGIFDDVGTALMVLLIEKMPDVAKVALGQFYIIDKALRKQYFYLNYLEQGVWKKMASKRGNSIRTSYARTPLETICIYNENELIMHPVILQLITIKWNLFGRMYSMVDVVINFLYTLLWTVIGITLPKGETNNSFYTPFSVNWWRITLELISVSLAVYFILTQMAQFKRVVKREQKYKEWRVREVERDLQYAHPRWPEERRYLISQMDNIRNSNVTSYWKDGWNIFEWITFASILSVIGTRVAACMSGSVSSLSWHRRTFLLLLVLLWLRFMKCCRCYQSLGPFITMLNHVFLNTMKFIFLFFEFFIPYVCTFWIVFGGNSQVSEFEKFNDLVYQVFLMTLVSDFEQEQLTKSNKLLAQILIGSYITIAAIVCLNLYIALMNETFNRVYASARATAFMLQANRLMELERSLGREKKKKVKHFMDKECSPQVIYETGGSRDEVNDDKQLLTLYQATNSLKEIKEILSDKSLLTETKGCQEIIDLMYQRLQMDKKELNEIKDWLFAMQNVFDNVSKFNNTGKQNVVFNGKNDEGNKVIAEQIFKTDSSEYNKGSQSFNPTIKNNSTNISVLSNKTINQTLDKLNQNVGSQKNFSKGSVCNLELQLNRDPNAVTHPANENFYLQAPSSLKYASNLSLINSDSFITMPNNMNYLPNTNNNMNPLYNNNNFSSPTTSQFIPQGEKKTEKNEKVDAQTIKSKSPSPTTRRDKTHQPFNKFNQIPNSTKGILKESKSSLEVHDVNANSHLVNTNFYPLAPPNIKYGSNLSLAHAPEHFTTAFDGIYYLPNNDGTLSPCMPQSQNENELNKGLISEKKKEELFVQKFEVGSNKYNSETNVSGPVLKMPTPPNLRKENINQSSFNLSPSSTRNTSKWSKANLAAQNNKIDSLVSHSFKSSLYPQALLKHASISSLPPPPDHFITSPDNIIDPSNGFIRNSQSFSDISYHQSSNLPSKESLLHNENTKKKRRRRSRSSKNKKDSIEVDALSLKNSTSETNL